jgi:DNA polymerase IV
VPRTILFIDPPAFCTTVEALVAPALRTRPVAVAPPGAERAVVLALSTEARRAGIERGMVVRQARKICPDLVLIPPNPRLYARASSALHEILRAYAPVIEPRGYGHAFLDLTGTGRLFGPPVDVAARVRREVRERLRFPLSVGVAANKLVSQAAVRADRRSDGRDSDALIVPFGVEAGFLAPHPLIVLPDLHPRVRSRLDDYQLDRIGEVAAIPESALCAVFGGAGRTLRARALGIDPRPVLPPERLAELSAAHILTTDTNDLGVLHPLLRMLTERLGRRLRRGGLVARRLRLTVGYADHTDSARAAPLPISALDADLWDAARRAFALVNNKRIAVRGMTVSLERVEEASGQMELWGTEGETACPERSEGTERANRAEGEVPEGNGVRCWTVVCHPEGANATEGSSPPASMTAEKIPRYARDDIGAVPPFRRSAPLQRALDTIRSRYGARGVARGSQLAALTTRDAPRL